MDWAQVFFVVFIAIPLVVIWVGVLVDIVRRTDLSGFAAAAWLLALFVFPIVGGLFYFATRPSAPVLRGTRQLTPEELERQAAADQAQAAAFETPAGTGPQAMIRPSPR